MSTALFITGSVLILSGISMKLKDSRATALVFFVGLVCVLMGGALR